MTDMHDVKPTPQSAEPARGLSMTDLRHRARRILNRTGKRSNRLTLVLAVTILLTVAVGSYMAASGAYMLGLLLGASIFVSDLIAYGLMGVLGLFVVLPLGASVFRLACLAVLESRAYTSPMGLAVTDDTPELLKLLNPFTSRSAYGRCMAVGLGAFGWAMLWGGIPFGAYRLLANQYDRMANQRVSAELCDLLTILTLLACLCFSLLMLCLSGYRAGFGFFAFAHPDLSVREVNRYFKGFRRNMACPFALRLGFVGWILLSFLAVLVPFVLHTIPWALCSAALYGATLRRS